MPTGVFPFHDADAYLASLPFDFRTGDGFREWQAGDGTTRFTLEPLELRLPDDRVIRERVILSHESDPLQGLSAEVLAHLNRFAPIGALITAFSGKPALFATKAGVFDGDSDAAAAIYSPLLCMQAGFAHLHVARLVRGELEGDPADSPLDYVNELPPYPQQDYESVKARMDQQGFVGSLEPRHYTCEFPWDEGALSNVLLYDDGAAWLRERGGTQSMAQSAAAGGRTSLFQIYPRRHPLYGNGVQAMLEVPLSGDPQNASLTATILNHLEFDTPAAPPLFGAWCAGPRSPAFVSFVPNQMCLPGLLHNLAVWAMARHFWVRLWAEQVGLR
jgi:hypothetical protein